MAGVCLGMVVGISVVHPIRDWKQWVIDGTTHVLPDLLPVFSLLWLTTHFPSHPTADVMMAAGVICVVVGMSARIYGTGERRLFAYRLLDGMVSGHHVDRDRRRVDQRFMGNRRISGAALSDSLVGRPPRCHQGCLTGRATACSPPPSRAILAEIPLMAALALAILFIPQLKGLLPIF